MLKKSFRSVQYLLILLVLLVIPVRAWAGFGFFGTDGVDFQLISFWDLRGRDSFVQVTNTGGLPITVHVQIFNAGANCSELDFYDHYTGGDTHVYNLSNIIANDPLENPLNLALPEDGFGAVVVTVVDGDFGPAIDDFVLISNFRVIDASGFEYRSNSVGIISFSTFFPAINFNNVDGARFSDVVGIALSDVGPGPFEVTASTSLVSFTDVFLFDDAENPTSCDDVTFSCTPTNFDVGINDALPNSEVAGRICPGNFDGVGVVRLIEDIFAADAFAGFVGINNGDGTGSMDLWWAGLLGGPSTGGINGTSPTEEKE